jgi:hypothetical protein
MGIYSQTAYLKRLVSLLGFTFSKSGLPSSTSTPLLSLYSITRYDTAMQKLRIERVNFGWKIAHEHVSRRQPISLYTSVARTRIHTYAANVWDCSVV